MAYPAINIRPVETGNFGDGSVGRKWYTGSGPYRTGDIHVVPLDYGSALFAELKVVNYGDERCEVVVADTWSCEIPAATMVQLLHDDSFVLNAISNAVKALPTPQFIGPF